MAKEVISTKDMSRDDWLQARRSGIGGSDVSAIAGLNKWKSAVSVYLDKTGQLPEEDSGSEAAYFGNVLEEVVAQEFTKRTGMKVRSRHAILQHPEHSFMYANVDRLIIGKKEGLECKTASEYLKGEWEGEEVPAAYLLQCQHYMAVTGYNAWWISVLIGGNKFIYKKIERDEDIINYLIQLEKDFWENHVLVEIPPLFDGSDASENLLKALYPQAEPASEIQLAADVEPMLDAIDQLSEDIKSFESQKKEYENRIKNLMGEKEKGYVKNRIVSWKNYESSRIDSKRLKEEQPELYQKYLNTTTARRFTVK